jgi:hypothetical protein
MVGRSAGDGSFSSVKAQRAKVKMFDKYVNNADWVVLGNIIFQILGKQCALHSVIAFNEPFHLAPSSQGLSRGLFYRVFNGEAYVLTQPGS